jgi:hypothetical protein
MVYKFERALAELYTTSRAVKAKIRSLMVQYTPDTIACAWRLAICMASCFIGFIGIDFV